MYWQEKTKFVYLCTHSICMCFAIALTTISQLRMELFKDKEVRIKKSFSAFVWRIPLTQLRTKKESFLLITKKFNKFQLYSNEHVLWLSINKIIISIQCMHGKFGKFIEKKNIWNSFREWNQTKNSIRLILVILHFTASASIRRTCRPTMRCLVRCGSGSWDRWCNQTNDERYRLAIQ